MKIQGWKALSDMNPLTRFSLALFIVFFLLYVTALRASIQNGEIEFAQQIIDQTLALQNATAASEISKKPAKQLDKHLKKTIDNLQKAIESLRQGDNRKLKKHYKKLKHAMDNYIKLLSQKKRLGVSS